MKDCVASRLVQIRQNLILYDHCTDISGPCTGPLTVTAIWLPVKKTVTWPVFTITEPVINITVIVIVQMESVAVVVLARLQQCASITISFPIHVPELPDAIAPVIQLPFQETTLLFSQHMIFTKLPEHSTGLAPVFS